MGRKTRRKKSSPWNSSMGIKSFSSSSRFLIVSLKSQKNKHKVQEILFSSPRQYYLGLLFPHMGIHLPICGNSRQKYPGMLFPHSKACYYPGFLFYYYCPVCTRNFYKEKNLSRHLSPT